MAYADRHLLVKFRDQPYKYYPGKATPPLARECRQVFGVGPAELWTSWFKSTTFEPDQAASLVWLCRRQMAEHMGLTEFAWTLEQVDAMITSDVVAENLSIEFKDFASAPDAPVEDIDTVTATDDDGHLEVPADPEG